MSGRIGKILGILLSISIIVAGLCLMVQCLSIYNSGDKPYSREAVARAFDRISVPVLVCLALMLITNLYNLFVDSPSLKKGASGNASYIIKAITRRREIIYDEGLAKEHRTRRIHNIVLSILTALGFGCFFVYALNPSNYHQSEINASMIKAIAVFGICIVLPFIYSIICIIINENSRRREIEILRTHIKDAPIKAPEAKASDCKFLTVLKVTALAIITGIILFGLFSGGTEDVLTKAINICTECIGLG